MTTTMFHKDPPFGGRVSENVANEFVIIAGIIAIIIIIIISTQFTILKGVITHLNWYLLQPDFFENRLLKKVVEWLLKKADGKPFFYNLRSTLTN